MVNYWFISHITTQVCFDGFFLDYHMLDMISNKLPSKIACKFIGKLLICDSFNTPSLVTWYFVGLLPVEHNIAKNYHQNTKLDYQMNDIPMIFQNPSFQSRNYNVFQCYSNIG